MAAFASPAVGAIAFTMARRLSSRSSALVLLGLNDTDSAAGGIGEVLCVIRLSAAV